MQGLAGLSDPLLAGAQASEVLCRARHHVGAELHHSSGSSSNNNNNNNNNNEIQARAVRGGAGDAH